MTGESDVRRRDRPGAERNLDLDGFARALAQSPVPDESSWRPWFVRLSSGEASRFADVCRTHHVKVLDAIELQLADLAAIRLPAGTSVERAQRIADELAASGERTAFGCWVYFPWQATVVHLLDADAYFDVITDRNRDKITRHEQQLLYTKRVGVVGLSVGGEAAVTLAQEHLCGHIVLADFDRLDLSNLNRLNAGCDELGVNKAVIAARRIARIDPYLRVTIYEEGVTSENAAAFLDGLDLLVEECDSLPLKYELRRLARERRLNIVFAGDERGFLSVEPYADEPDLAEFHGRIDAPQPPRASYATPQQFLRALTVWLGGWDAISEASRRSLEQIGTSLCGYPQLASEARYAAGQLGHVARRLLLGERLPPFLGHLDLSQYLPARASTPTVV